MINTASLINEHTTHMFTTTPCCVAMTLISDAEVSARAVRTLILASVLNLYIVRIKIRTGHRDHLHHQ